MLAFQIQIFQEQTLLWLFVTVLCKGFLLVVWQLFGWLHAHCHVAAAFCLYTSAAYSLLCVLQGCT